MHNYDFNSLNDKDFEDLVVDVISVRENIEVERFKPGKDGGVDGRFYSAPDSEVIIQCKHWLKSGISALIKKLKDSEIDKVKKLNPQRYIFATSLNLSKKNKQDIKELFHPYIKNFSDILGNEDINNIISKHPSLEKRHYKLWMTSTNVLSMIMNNAILGRSEFKKREILSNLKIYSRTGSHDQAEAKLEELHSVILCGEPGVGKTFLADQLTYQYVASGYELIYIENSLNEAEEVFEKSDKQIFYFDDFLGSNYLEAFDAHEDSHIVNFIKRVQASSQKRFVLTSRTNILFRAKRLSEYFELKNISENEFLLAVENYGDLDKAKILYNHIWFSNLDNRFIEELYKDKRYLKIIKHKNFNPRLIQFITDIQRLESLEPESYWQFVSENLENPAKIWKRVFDNQVDTTALYMVLAVVINGNRISEKDLKSFYHRLLELKPELNKSTFDLEIKALTGALLNRRMHLARNVFYEPFNPSIADYLISAFIENTGLLNDVVSCLKTKESLDALSNFKKNKKLSGQDFKDIIRRQFKSFIVDFNVLDDFGPFEMDLFNKAVEILDKQSIHAAPMDLLLNKVFSLPRTSHIEEYLQFIDDCIETELLQVDDNRLTDLIEFWLSIKRFELRIYIPSVCFKVLSKIIKNIDPDGGEITEKFKHSVCRYLSYDITDDAISSGMFDDVFDEDDYVDEDNLMLIASEYFDGYYIEFDAADLEDIVDSFDMDVLIEANRENSDSESSIVGMGSTRIEEDSDELIEDLFYKDD